MTQSNQQHYAKVEKAVQSSDNSSLTVESAADLQSETSSSSSSVAGDTNFYYPTNLVDEDGFNEELGGFVGANRVPETASNDIEAVPFPSHGSRSRTGSMRSHKGADNDDHDHNKNSRPRSNSITSMISRENRHWSLFSTKLRHERKKIYVKFLEINFFMAVVCFTALCFYFGALYNTNHYLFKVQSLLVIQDDIPPPGVESLTSVLPELTRQVPTTWHIYNTTEFAILYNTSVTDIDNKIIDLIYKEEFWMALSVRPNMTRALYDSLTNNSAPPFNATKFLLTVYESGRDPSNMKSYILPPMTKLQNLFQKYYQQTYLPSLLRNITSGYPVANVNTINIENWSRAGSFGFTNYDHRPLTDHEVLAPLQVGITYLFTLSVFQMSLFSSLQKQLSTKLKPRHLILFRYLFSVVAYLVLSLFYCTVSAVFQVSFTAKYGKAGFVVYWFSIFLLTLSIGGVNELVIPILTVYFPSYISYWLTIWTIINIAPSFYPLTLNNQFYRYGYGVPVHQGVEIMRVIFLDVSPHKLRRNYGILGAWVAFYIVALPFALKFAGKKAKENAKASAKRAAHTAFALATARAKKAKLAAERAASERAYLAKSPAKAHKLNYFEKLASRFDNANST